jgi:hypothetical protein
VKALTKRDYLYIFYAGHGFSKNGHNYITCYDTDPDDLEDTSIKPIALIRRWIVRTPVRNPAIINDLGPK